MPACRFPVTIPQLKNGLYALLFYDILAAVQSMGVVCICAHYTVFSEEEILEMRQIIAEVERKIYGGQALSKEDIRPSNIAPVITSRGAEPMKWGFPHPRGKNVIINARCETALEKPMFREAAAKRRCVIPAIGYFEWGETPDGQLSLLDEPAKSKSKEKYLFTLPDSPVLFLAGFYNEYILDNGFRFPHYVVMTMDANSSVSDIHDRMPVILRGGQHTKWLETGELADSSPMLARRKA